MATSGRSGRLYQHSVDDKARGRPQATDQLMVSTDQHLLRYGRRQNAKSPMSRARKLFDLFVIRTNPLPSPLKRWRAFS